MVNPSRMFNGIMGIFFMNCIFIYCVWEGHVYTGKNVKVKGNLKQLGLFYHVGFWGSKVLIPKPPQWPN